MLNTNVAKMIYRLYNISFFLKSGSIVKFYLESNFFTLKDVKHIFGPCLDLGLPQSRYEFPLSSSRYVREKICPFPNVFFVLSLILR